MPDDIYFYIRINGARVYFDESPVGEPALLLHGTSVSEQCEDCASDIAESAVRTALGVKCACGRQYAAVCCEEGGTSR